MAGLVVGPRFRRRGYTMAELLVVLATILLLGAIVGGGSVAVLRDTGGRTAEGNARGVLLAQQSFARQYGSYTGFTRDLGEVDGVEVVNGSSDQATQVAIALGESGSLGLAARRSGDECYLLKVTSLAAGAKVIEPDASGRKSTSCTASEALALTDSSSGITSQAEAEDMSSRSRSATD